MVIFYLLIGVVIGVFIPSPIDNKIRLWCKALKDKVVSLFKKGD